MHHLNSNSDVLNFLKVPTVLTVYVPKTRLFISKTSLTKKGEGKPWGLQVIIDNAIFNFFQMLAQTKMLCYSLQFTVKAVMSVIASSIEILAYFSAVNSITLWYTGIPKQRAVTCVYR